MFTAGGERLFMKKIVIRTVKWLLVLAVLAGGCWAGLLYLKKQDQAEVATLVTSSCSRGDVIQAVTATGQLNPVVNVQVGSQISGILTNLNADFNSPVKQGQIIAQLDSSTYRASVLQAEGDLASAKAGLELAQVNASRAKELNKNKLISDSENDKTIADLHQAEAMVKIREASLERVKVDFARCTIYSPIDGIVISRNVDVGQTVAASMSAPTLFVIAKDLTKMQIDANVSEADVGAVEDGLDVTFTVDAFAGRTFTGKVVQVRNSPITIQNVVSYDTVIEVSNDDRKLKPGMTANVSIITASKPGVLRIPNAALRFRPPEVQTNFTLAARLLLAAGLKKKPEPFVEPVQAAKSGDTNAPGGGSNQLAAPTITWTGNETPEEFFKKTREAREKGEELPPAVRAKMAEMRKSGGGGGGGGGGGAPKGPPRPSNKPATRTIYAMASTNAPSAGETPKIRAMTVRTGISDGIYTEVLSGLEDGVTIVTGVNLPKSAAAAQAPAVNPFGGGGRGFGR